HFKRDCPKLKNKDGEKVNAPGWVYTIGNAKKRGNTSRDPDSNFVTGTFLLNNHYASILFDTGANRIFISTAFSSLIDIFPAPLRNSYDVELADGKIVEEDLFTSCIEHGILQDYSKPSNDNTNVVNAPREPFVVNQDPGKNSSQSPPQINHHCCYGCGDPLEGTFYRQCTCKLCGNGAHYGYNCPSKVPIIPNPEPFNNQTIMELPPTVQNFNPKADLVHNSPNVFDPPPQLPFISCEFCENDARYGHYFTTQVLFVYPKQGYNQDFNFSQDFQDFQQQDLCCENWDGHLDTITAIELDEFIKSSVEKLVPIPSEFEGESECDSFSDEDFSKEIYLNPLFDEEIIPIKIDPHPFNAESNIIESLLNHDSSIIYSSKIDSLFNEFVGELTLLRSILPGINEIDCHPEEETNFTKRLFNDSLSLPKKESFYFDIPSFSRPPAKPPDGNTGILNVKMMGGISEQKVLMPRFMITLVLNQEKSPDILSHKGLKASQLSAECPMMIHGKNTLILDVPLFHFYPP
nr:hypothetical protein [Tanacetum cinerariifolium]